MNVLPFDGDDEMFSNRSSQYSHIEHSELRKVTENAIISNYNDKRAKVREKNLRKSSSQIQLMHLSNKIANSKNRSIVK